MKKNYAYLFDRNLFAIAVKSKRGELGWKQEDVAKYFACSKQMVKMWEGCTGRPGLELYATICEWLAVGMDTFFHRVDI